MADMTELDRINQAKEFFSRYDQLVEAIEVNKQNKIYLKTYIHNPIHVEKEFNMKNKVIKAVGLSLAAGVLVLVILAVLLGFDSLVTIIVAAVGGGATAIGLGIFGVCLQRFRLHDAKVKQVEVNEGIQEQLEVLKLRDEQLIKQKDDFAKGLKKRVTFMSLDYVNGIDQIKGYIESGEASTCEEAVELYESNLLMQEMSAVMMASETEKEEAISEEEAKEKFGDPLEVIKKKKREKKKKAKRVPA